MITWMEAERTKRYERFRREKSDNENRIFLNSLQALIQEGLQKLKQKAIFEKIIRKNKKWGLNFARSEIPKPLKKVRNTAFEARWFVFFVLSYILRRRFEKRETGLAALFHASWEDLPPSEAVRPKAQKRIISVTENPFRIKCVRKKRQGYGLEKK